MTTGAPVEDRDPIAGDASASVLLPRLAADLAAVGSVRVSTRGGGQGRSVSRDYAVDQAGDCSGSEVDSGTRLRFVRRGDVALVTTRDGRLGRSLAGRWLVVDAASYLPFCLAGTDLLPGSSAEAAALLLAGRALGPNVVDGRHTLHFRTADQSSEGTRDSWIGITNQGVLQVVRFAFDDGSAHAVSDFTAFGLAEVDPLPPESRRVTPGDLRPA